MLFNSIGDAYRDMASPTEDELLVRDNFAGLGDRSYVVSAVALLFVGVEGLNGDTDEGRLGHEVTSTALV